MGAKFRIFLQTVSVPRDADDDRTAAQRRIDGLDELLDRVLGAGLPSTDRIKPHISVIVHDQTLKDALNRTVVEVAAQRPSKPLDLNAEPAILEGFGPIGPALLAYIAFGGNLTPILVAGFTQNRRILDVGRTKRIATKKQTIAIRYRQNGVCANRGCHHPIGEIHHVIAWADGGRTELSNLAGLCRKDGGPPTRGAVGRGGHALVTVGRLTMTGTYETGYTFTHNRARPRTRTG